MCHGWHIIGRDRRRCHGAVVRRNGTLVGHLPRQRRRRNLPNVGEDGHSLVDVRDDCRGRAWCRNGRGNLDCLGVRGAATNRPETQTKAIG